jgi:hypothetical protein
VFLARADAFAQSSPLYADLSRRFADDPVAAEIVGPEPKWEKGLRLLGGLHYLVLAGEAEWDDPLEAHKDFLTDFVATQRVQTNEVLRAWLYAPLFLRAVQRTGADVIDLIELGSSAGLLLGWDRYHYVYEAGEWGPADAPLTLAGEERRPVPADLLALRPRVRRKVGVDLAPLDVTSDESLRLLKAFVWAGHDERLERLDRAFAAVRADPPEIVRGDYVELLPELLADRDPDVLTIVLASATLAYLTDEQVARVRSALEEAGRSGGLVFVSTGKGRTSEHGHWGLRIVYYPGAEREFAGEADYHGAWLDWWLEPLAGRRSRRAKRGSAPA